MDSLKTLFDHVVASVPDAVKICVTTEAGGITVERGVAVQTAAPARQQVIEAKTAPMNEITEGYVTAPLVGVFYAAPASDAEPFVKVGQRVKKGDILCIIEAMKLLNEIESTDVGIIENILVENGAMVEFGQPLFSIKAE